MSHDTAVHTEAATITVIGPLDVRSLTATRDEVYRHVTDHDTVLDLTRCEWLDGSALRMLVAATIAAQRGGHRLICEGVDQEYVECSMSLGCVLGSSLNPLCDRSPALEWFRRPSAHRSLDS